jgi:hypothetical protein
VYGVSLGGFGAVGVVLLILKLSFEGGLVLFFCFCVKVVVVEEGRMKGYGEVWVGGEQRLLCKGCVMKKVRVWVVL